MALNSSKFCRIPIKTVYIILFGVSFCSGFIDLQILPHSFHIINLCFMVRFHCNLISMLQAQAHQQCYQQVQHEEKAFYLWRKIRKITLNWPQKTNNSLCDTLALAVGCHLDARQSSIHTTCNNLQLRLQCK
jgi:hypothetical protein